MLFERHGNIVNRDGQAAARRVFEADLLDPVYNFGGAFGTQLGVHARDEVFQAPFVQRVVYKAQFRRDDFIEQNATHRRLDQFVFLAGARTFAIQHQFDLGVQRNVAEVVRERHFIQRAENLALAFRAFLVHSEIVDAEHHVFGRLDNGFARRGLEQVMAGEHQAARLFFRRFGQRNVNRHLIAVKVGIERRADERVNLNRAAFNENHFESLNAQAVESRRAVEEHRMIFDDLFQDIPYLGARPIHQAFGAFDIVRVVVLDELAHDERFEQFKRHAFGQTALI